MAWELHPRPIVVYTPIKPNRWYTGGLYLCLANLRHGPCLGHVKPEERDEHVKHHHRQWTEMAWRLLRERS